ncbi:AMP-binding protein [Paraburkholderia kururiensis]|uniref:AMP-binding protein n=1 Tax=Paraburkholderia kururiensis TaxID=984307 RepID=A0ABZ0WLZ7_9BURK|nr:AMP-binding protein [Paraburkholderia kururiensis]WQD78395.1 AMP-binding protein [Paraburkholderia kururiensis]
MDDAVLMTVDALPDAATVRFPADLEARIAHWAQTRPQALALLHKQRGQWGALRWEDVPQRVAQLRQGLELQRPGPGSGSRLAVSGALEPDLILIALAAHAAGAAVVSVDRNAHADTLRRALEAAAPTHAFVQDRKTVSAWLASGYAPPGPATLYSAQSVAHHGGAWQLVALDALAGPAGSDSAFHARTGLRHALRHQRVSWVEEGTEWPGGLEQVLACWLEDGDVLASPEVGASSTRDRHEVQPDRLLASPAHLERLEAQLHERLAAAGSWSRALTDRAAERPGGLFSRWLLGRVDALHGLPRGGREVRGVLEAAVPAAGQPHEGAA